MRIELDTEDRKQVDDFNYESSYLSHIMGRSSICEAGLEGNGYGSFGFHVVSLMDESQQRRVQQ
jgi:hypothetical protein